MWPWDWIIAAGNAVNGISKQIVDWVNSIIASVVSWVNDAITAIWRAIQGAWRDIQMVWGQLVSFIAYVGGMVWSAVDRVYRSITAWVKELFDYVWNFVNYIYHVILYEIDRLRQIISGWISSIYRWVISNVWDPLWKAYTDIRNWFTQQIAAIWNYIQHPELLAQLIGGYLLSVWWQLVQRFAVPIVRWIIAHMRSMVGEVFDLIEHVISSVL